MALSGTSEATLEAPIDGAQMLNHVPRNDLQAPAVARSPCAHALWEAAPGALLSQCAPNGLMRDRSHGCWTLDEPDDWFGVPA